MDVDYEDGPQVPPHSRNLFLPRYNYFFARFRLMVSASCFDGYRRGIPVQTKFRWIPSTQAMAVRWVLSKLRACIQSQLLTCVELAMVAIIFMIIIFIIARNHFGWNLCRPFALGQRLSFRARRAPIVLMTWSLFLFGFFPYLHQNVVSRRRRHPEPHCN